jgi:glycine betaine/proline transport system substrate-binding protein
VDLPIDTLNQALAQMSEKRTPPRDAALAFMRQHPHVWKAWLPEQVATKVEGGL